MSKEEKKQKEENENEEDGAIYHFKGKYYFLSNFYSKLANPVVLFNDTYPTSEHAYNAAKTTDMKIRKKIRETPSPRTAKYIGRSLKLRKDWEEIKYSVMNMIVKNKFERNMDLKEKLMETGKKKLVEGNDWGDRYWGMVKNKDGEWEGENNLGKILMNLREDFLNEEK